MNRSLKIVENDHKYLAKAIALKYFPIAIVKARGSKVWDTDGNEYIDFLTSAAVYNVGHTHPKIVKAIKDQLDNFINYTVAYLYNEPSVRLAKKLTEITPGIFEKKVTFGFSGSDAVDSSIKLARAYTKKKNIISFHGSYHGTTLGSLSATGIVDEKIKSSIIPPSNIIFTEYPDPYRNKWNIDGYEKPGELTNYALNELEEKISEASNEIAGILFEPIQGDAGIIIPPKEFIVGLREIADKYDSILIDEEVQTGLGRTGLYWAIEHYNTVPELLISSKALGGGMPISAVIGRTEILDSLPPPFLVFTHAGHAVLASAALATIEVIEEEDLMHKAVETGRYMRNRLMEMMNRYEIIGDVRGSGMLIGVDIVENRESRKPDRSAALKICWRSWEKGLIMISFGKHGNVLRIAPPLNISRNDVDTALNILEDSIKDLINDKIPDEIVHYLKGW